MIKPNPDQRVYFTDSDDSEYFTCVLCDIKHTEEDIDFHVQSCVRSQKDLFGSKIAIENFKMFNLLDPKTHYLEEDIDALINDIIRKNRRLESERNSD